MAEINDLNVTDASNIDRFPELQAPSTVNDGARALEGIIARWNKDLNGSVLTTGTSTAYVYAANQTLTAYYDGLQLGVDFHTASGAAPTVNVDALGAKALVWPDGTAVAADEIPADAKALIVYDGTSFQVITATESTASKQADVITTRGDVIRGSSGAAAERLAVGTANQFLYTDGTDLLWGAPAAADAVAGVAETATQAEQETGTATNKIVTPGRQHYHLSATKAWVTFDGTGTPAIDADYGVSSITDNGAADYTINLATAFSSTSYGWAGSARRNSDAALAPTAVYADLSDTKSTTALQIRVATSGIGAFDSTEINVAFWGDQ